jgi:hypothetical protein
MLLGYRQTDRHDFHTRFFFTLCKEYSVILTQFPNCSHPVITELLIDNVSTINTEEV